MKISAIILAAGIGSRMNLGYNKMFYKIDNQTIIEKTLATFLTNIQVDQIIIVANKDELFNLKELLNNERITYVSGGQERFNSVANGLEYVTNDYVLIHDGARCHLSSRLLQEIIDATFQFKATALGVVSKDTIHLTDDNNNIIETLPRANTFVAQTPQGFETATIKKAYQLLLKNNDNSATDDVMIVNKYLNIQAKIILSDYSNIKITTKEDL